LHLSILFIAFNLDFYTDVLDLRYLLDRIDEDKLEAIDRDGTENFTSSFQNKFRKMNELLIEVIEDFSLVSFHPLQIEDIACLQKLVGLIDKTNGYVFTSMDWKNAVAKDYTHGGQIAEVQEKYLSEVSFEEDLNRVAHRDL
jgi:hypothetical protein